MIGIYKITNPKNKIYIGQSNNIEKRFKQYEKVKNIKTQKKLYFSLIKYGFENHNFEIICECDLNELTIKERYYQELFNSVYNGLNCHYVDINRDYTNVGRKEIDPKEKKILFRIFVKKSILDAIPKERLKELINQFIKQLENETYN
jgi:group I intron endonuclease